MANPTGNHNHIQNLEHHPSFRAKKVIPYVDDGAGNAVMEATRDLIVKYVPHSSLAGISYLGKAKPGTAGSSALWQIRRIDETSGVVILFADGNIDFDNVWDNREALSYS
jgi:hypothetical protein